MENITKVSDFDSVQTDARQPGPDILEWSHGEVTKPETINYRTQRYEPDGLFCEKIFGPSKDWECYCGKYKRIRYKGIVCDKCGVEVTRSIVRRERMGHIKLATPVSHIWFLRGVPSKIGLVSASRRRNLEHVIYFSSYIIMDVNENLKEQIARSTGERIQGQAERNQSGRKERDEAREDARGTEGAVSCNEGRYQEPASVSDSFRSGIFQPVQPFRTGFHGRYRRGSHAQDSRKYRYSGNSRES